MARAAVLGRLTWRPAELVSVRAETSAARTLVFDVPEWPGHVAGQHVDLRLTAEDGYTAQRSYSLASAAGGRVELTVQRVDGGEVSGYLADVMAPGDRCEVRGPVGGYFTWDPEDPSPVLLVAGGSGLVPLMSMVRTRAEAGSRVPFRLIYSVRTPADVLFADELRRRVREDKGLDIEYAFTRAAPGGARRPPGRIDAALLGAAGWPAEFAPTCYVCGPTGFVEAVADLLVGAGHAAERVRTERFG
ncbi:ferredoxin reductase [Luedemannella helvata]|uniref:Ferredoxin reductase n=1 Tax=Luedemannella helvata TaxID=349315 RepID=A0ABN2KVG3_9ACTN